ncbi:MAG: hypothetical protein ACRC1M_01600 [Methanobacteriaceae archaeon]
MIAKTNMYGKHQTTVPKEIRNRLGVDENVIIEWDINDNNEAVLKFKKKLSLEDMIGRYTAKEPFDSVNVAKEIEKGGKGD